jgi:PAS domain S-box-containing protein
MAESSPTTVLLDYAQDKVAVVGESGTVSYVNEAVADILGIAPAEFVGENAFEYIHPEDRPEARDTFEAVIGEAGYSEATVTYRHATADGSWVWLESRMSNLTDETLDGYVVSSRDVTDRVDAEEGQRRSERRLREIAEKTSEVLWMFSGDWQELLFLNSTYEDIYGLPVAEVRENPQSFLNSIHPDDVPAVREAMDRLSEGESTDMEYRVNPETDYSRWVWAQAEPIVEDGEVVRIVGFARDITDRRRRERQLAVMDTLLRHNLRNDVNAILANAELIEQQPTENPAERAAVIRRVGEQLIATAEKERDILDLLDRPPEPRRLDLQDLVRCVARDLRTRHPDATIDLDTAPAAAEALAETEQAVLELVDNAIEHAVADEPHVVVTTRTDGEWVTVTVSDDCPAIPENEHRVLTGDHEMTATYHTSGLGLWLAYWVVDLSDGYITFATGQDGGNTVTVHLPRADA